MEAKVSFHVRQYLRECEDRGVRPSDESVTAHLREAHAEYQRKPLVRRRADELLLMVDGTPDADTDADGGCGWLWTQGALKKVVGKVLKRIQKREKPGGGAGGGGSDGSYVFAERRRLQSARGPRD